MAMGTLGEGEVAPPPGGVRIFPPGAVPHAKPGEPLYAQVNREKKKNRQYEGGNSDGVEHWQYDERRPPPESRPTTGGGDSWV